MKKIILALFVCLCLGAISLIHQGGSHSLATFLGITGASLIAAFCYLSFLEMQKVPDIRKEVAEALAERDSKIQEIKNHMGKFDMSRASYSKEPFRF